MAIDHTSPLRIGTWNILSYEDEYNVDYGCPLSIAICDRGGDGASVNRSSLSMECTKRRYQRIWKVLEEEFVLSNHNNTHQRHPYDIICLQEVSDTFLSLQQPSSSSNWTLLNRNNECILLLSKYSSFEVVAMYNITSIPKLSGCTAVPIVVVQPPQVQEDAPVNNNSTGNHTNRIISYVVGSIHTQASVTNMTAWYETTIAAIRNTTNYLPATTTPNATSNGWMQFPVMIVMGGDFNHNLTSNNSNNVTMEQPPDHWRLIAQSPNTILVQGTTQKEYNYMGNYDGFLVSSTAIHLSVPEDMVLPTNSTTPTTNMDAEDVWYMTVTNTSVHMNGFIPKVVQGFPQQNYTIQELAQFALISHNNNTNINFTTNETTFWNTSTLQDYYRRYNNNNETNDTSILPVLPSDLHLVFSPTSTVGSNISETVVVPYSHPYNDALSDHLFVSATFSVVYQSNSTNNASTGSSSSTPTSTTGTNNAPPSTIARNNDTINNNTNNNINNNMDTSKSGSSAFLSQLTPVGRAFVVIVMASVLLIGLRFIWKCYCRRQQHQMSSSSQHRQYENDDRVAMIDSPPQSPRLMQ